MTGTATSVASGRVAYTVGVAGPGDHGGYRVFVVAGGHASGVSVAAQRGIRSGVGRRGHHHDHPGGVHRVRPPTRAGPRWAL